MAATAPAQAPMLAQLAFGLSHVAAAAAASWTQDDVVGLPHASLDADLAPMSII